MNRIEKEAVFDTSSVSGSTVLPLGNNLSTLARTLVPYKSAIAYNKSDNYLYFGNGTEWIPTGATLVNPTNPVTFIYVSTTGNNANDGLTALTPVLTLAKALEILFELGWNESAVINFAVGNYNFPASEVYNFRSTAKGSNSQIIIIKGANSSILSSQTVVSANTVDLQPSGLVSIIVAGPLVIGSFTGLYVEFTSGALIGQKFQISNNTSTTVTILGNTPPGGGDAFNVRQNITTFTVPPSSVVVFQNGFLAFQDIEIVGGLNSTMQFLSIKIVPDNLKFTGMNSIINLFDTTIISSSFIGSLFDSFVTQNLGIVFLSVPGMNINVQATNVFAILSQVVFSRAYLNATTSNMTFFNFEISLSIALIMGANQLSTISALFTDCTGDGFMTFGDADVNLNNILCRNLIGNAIIRSDNSTNLSINNATVTTAEGLFDLNGSSFIGNNIIVTGITTFSSNFNVCRINLNNFTYESPKSINISTCIVSTNTFNLRGITDSNGLNMYGTNWRENNTVSFFNCSGNNCLTLQSSTVFINNFDHETSTSFSVSGGGLNINNLYLKSFVGPDPISINMTRVVLANISMNGINPENTDKVWTLTNASLNAQNWNHDGAITNTFFNLNNSSVLNLTNSAFKNTKHTIVGSNNGSTINMDNINVEDASKLITATGSKSIYLNNVFNGSVFTTPSGPFIDVGNGDLSLFNMNITGLTQDVINALLVACNFVDNIFETNSSNIILTNLCSFKINNNVLQNTGDAGIVLNSSTFSIDNTNITSVGVALGFYRNSKGYLNNATGGSSGNVAVNLQSGSSFADGGTNSITGSVLGEDVRTGSVPTPSAWGALVTNDFSEPSPNYVTITPP
jgi:hypothetical protein